MDDYYSLYNNLLENPREVIYISRHIIQNKNLITPKIIEATVTLLAHDCLENKTEFEIKEIMNTLSEHEEEYHDAEDVEDIKNILKTHNHEVEVYDILE